MVSQISEIAELESPLQILLEPTLLVLMTTTRLPTLTISETLFQEMDMQE